MSETAKPLILPARRAGAWTFSVLFFFDSLARSFTAAVLSVQAYDLLGSSQKVSMIGIVASGTVLALTLFLPLLFGRMRRRWAYTTGCLLMVAGACTLSTFTLPGQVIGTILRNVGAAVTSVTLQLYILDNIKKSDLTSSEPQRLATSTFAWVVGPFGGVWLYQHYGPVAPQLCCGAAALTLLAVFWFLRLHDPEVLPRGNLLKFNPLANVARFVAQPRLRLAWMIAFARSSFWAAFFTYGPLLMIEGGLGKSFGGALLSMSQLLLLTCVLFGWAAQRNGVRLTLSLCFAAISLASLAAGLAGTWMPLAAGCLMLVGAAGASGIDGIGAIPFLRSVRFHERQQMTSVYRSYIELSDLIPSMVYAVALRFTGVSIVFVIMGLFAGWVGAVTWRHLPKGM